jgi:hypothetical protein
MKLNLEDMYIYLAILNITTLMLLSFETTSFYLYIFVLFALVFLVILSFILGLTLVLKLTKDKKLQTKMWIIFLLNLLAISLSFWQGVRADENVAISPLEINLTAMLIINLIPFSIFYLYKSYFTSKFKT